MDFDMSKQYMYNNDIHNSKIISYKPNNLATMNTVNNNINILISREENHLNIHKCYLQIEFLVSGNGGGIIANVANARLVNYGVRALICSVNLETVSGKTIEYIDYGHPNLLMCKLLTSTRVEYESGFVRDQRERDSQLKGDHQAAQRSHK